MQAASDCADMSASFKTAMRHLAATVSIVSTSIDGQRFGMTATSVASVSVVPPALLVCVNKNASIHNPIRSRGLFWTNVLGEGHEESCFAFGGAREGEERFNIGMWETCENGLPLLVDAQANLLCRVAKTCEFATHCIFVATVLETRLGNRASPLVYLNGDFASVRRRSEYEKRKS